MGGCDADHGYPVLFAWSGVCVVALGRAAAAALLLCRCGSTGGNGLSLAQLLVAQLLLVRVALEA